MSLSRLEKVSIRSLLLGGAALALSTLSCGREPTGPGGSGMMPSKSIGFATEFPSAFPAYQAAGGSGVAFSSVRIVLSRPGGVVALDTMVTFPDSASELQLTLRVPLPASASNSGVPLVLNLDYVSADGVVLFHGGPVTVTAFPMTSDSTPPPPSEVTIPIKWVGPGAGATKVVIATDPIYADSGAAFTVTAQAQDPAGRVIPGTPIAYRVVDANVATINAATGVGQAGTKRASTLVIAELMGGQADTATLIVVKPPAEIIMAGGEAQTGAVGQNLAQPVMVIVFSTDTLPSPGVAVTFAAQNGGAAGATTVTTGPSGIAQTTWKLGPTAGPQTLTATVAGLTGSPVTFTATATSTGAGPAKALAFSSQPVGGLPGVAMPAFIVVARDSVGAVATSFNGTVTVAFGTNPGSATLSGTLSVTASSGVATFNNVKIDKIANGYTLVASATGLTSATSAAFTVANSSVATTTVTPKLDTLTAIGSPRVINAQARDSLNNLVAGRYTWVSRTPSVATVDTSGIVRSVTNGSTWIVATEVGGTKDSALVVVAQKIASVRVTPNPRSVYVGAKAQFTASAVDGLGVALASQPSFTWSTAAGAIATVDAAGLVTGNGIGSTAVQATAGALTGYAALTVKSQITRIVVSRDSAGFPTTASDTFSLAALARTRSYVATARDTTDTPIAGVTFTWTSTNGAVASLDSINTATVRATARANGIAAIRATAQGVSGQASLTVQQALVSIDLSPAAASVAPTGKTVVLARGKDANGYFIPGGSFAYTSAQPTIATVDAAGVVTGVANGTASLTATSGAITSNTSAITVGGAVPPAISFGRDTVAVGRAGTASIPVYLSTPSASAVTVNLAVADTFAFFTAPSTVSIRAGQTSINATLNGRNAGTTSVFAIDGGSTGYAGDTAVLNVQATVKFTTTGYSLNVTDQLPTQVLLSDPAPALGTYVTFTYENPGMVNVSPDPAFVKPGQLAADIVLIGAGEDQNGTTVTPVVAGVNGTPSTVYTYGARLTTSGINLLGVGQTDPNRYVQGSASFYNPLAVTISNSDSTAVVVPPSVTIPAGTYYAYYPAVAIATGRAAITLSSPGWTSGVDTIVVTTPHVAVCCAGTYNTTAPQFAVYAYAEDSLGYTHPRSDALLVTLTSTDPAVLKVLTPTVTIPAGQYYTSSGLAVPGGTPGTARIIVTASGHTPDSTSLYTVTGPKLSFNWTAARIGAGQQDQNMYVYTPNPVTGSPLVVNLTSTDSSIVAAPTTVTIPVGTYYGYFTVRGKASGGASFYATATGYTPDTASYTVTTPQIIVSSGTTLNNFGPSQLFTTYVADSVGTGHVVTAPVIVSYTSTNPSVLAVAALDTIQAGASSTSHASVTPLGVGTASVIATAPGHKPDTVNYTVQTPKLNFSWTTTRLGRRQYQQNFYITTPSTRTSDLPVTISQTAASVDSLSGTSLTITNATNIAYLNIAGTATGTDTLIATAAGYAPDTAIVIVTTPKFLASIASTANTTSPPGTVVVYTADSLGSIHSSLDPVVVRAVSSDVAVLQPLARGFQIAQGASNATTQVQYVGPGTATMTYDDSLGTGYQSVTTNTVTVTGPSLTLSGTTMLGLRQNSGTTGAIVSVPNPVTGSPLTVTLTSSDPMVATVPATVTIPVGQTYAYYQVTAQDATGTIQITATATGYTAATRNVQVTQPKFFMNPMSMNTTSPAQEVYVYAQDANGTSHYTNEDVVVTLASSLPTVGVTDSAIVTIPAGNFYSAAAKFIPGLVGATQISATDLRVASYKYTQATATVTVNTPALSLSFSTAGIGLGQYSDVYVYSANTVTSDLTVNLSHSSAATTSPASVTILAGQSSAASRIVGAATGADTLTYSATGYISTKGVFNSAVGRFDPLVGWPATLAQGDSAVVTIYARDVNQNTHGVAANTTLTLTPTSNLQFVSGGTNSVAITSVDIPVNQFSVQVYVKALTTGTGYANISNANYTTYRTPDVIVP